MVLLYCLIRVKLNALEIKSKQRAYINLNPRELALIQIHLQYEIPLMKTCTFKRRKRNYYETDYRISVNMHWWNSLKRPINQVMDERCYKCLTFIVVGVILTVDFYSSSPSLVVIGSMPVHSSMKVNRPFKIYLSCQFVIHILLA